MSYLKKRFKAKGMTCRNCEKIIEKQVKKIETEAAKGGAADKGRLGRWLKTLANMAPDIVEVMAASLGWPVAGFTAVFKKIVERARANPAET